MDMVFGVFSKSNVRFLKYITSQFFSKYSKSYNILNVKSCVKLNALKKKWAVLRPSTYMYLIELYNSFSEWS